jgi:hypothetical protein
VLSKARTGVATADRIGRRRWLSPRLIEGRDYHVIGGEGATVLVTDHRGTFRIAIEKPLIRYTEHGADRAVEILTNKQTGGRKRGRNYARRRDWIHFDTDD